MSTASHSNVLRHRGLRVALLTPFAFAICILLIGPLVLLVILSTESREGLEFSGSFVGFDNYSALTADSAYLRSVWWTVAYAFVTVAFQTLIGVTLAVALSSARRLGQWLLAVLLLPYALPTVVGCLTWRWLLSGSHAPVNVWGSRLGIIDQSFSWFTQTTIFATLVVVSVWMFTPFVVAMCYAKLRSIPENRYELAAAIGLGPLRTLWHVTLPELRSVLLTIVVLRLLWMASKFDVIWLMAGREAIGESARSVPVLSYITSFQAYRLSYGAAQSVAMLVVVFLALLAAMALLRRSRMV